MFFKLLLTLTGLVSLFLVYVAFQPTDMNISREIVINAAPDKIFPHLNHSQKANAWMPWSTIDPKAQMTYSGPQEGVGSISKWDSTGQMGTGQAEVVESVLNQSVKTRLTYSKPMVMSQLADISLAPMPQGTRVRWSVQGKNSFMGRVVCVFMNMDKVVGGNFEQGLAKLKSTVEASK